MKRDYRGSRIAANIMKEYKKKKEYKDKVERIKERRKEKEDRNKDTGEK